MFLPFGSLLATHIKVFTLKLSATHDQDRAIDQNLLPRMSGKLLVTTERSMKA